MPLKLIIACWIIFYIYWVASAPKVKATVERQNLWDSLYYRCFSALGGAMLFVTGPYPLGLYVLPISTVTRCAGVVICFLGLALAIWSRRTLGRNWSSMVTLKQDHELIERGPYRFVRHPIYSSMVLMALGSAVALNHLAGFLGLFPFFWGFWIKLRQEEAWMSRQFPEAYPAYRKRVRALVPFVF